MQPHDRLPYEPIVGRKPLRFPDGVRLVIWPVMSLEVWDISRPMARLAITPPQGQPLQPDHPNWSWHEYGMRVGFWRIKRMLEQLKMSLTATINARVCEVYPQVVRACLRQRLGSECAQLRTDPDAQARGSARRDLQDDGYD